MKEWEREARESIRDLVARYNASGDFGRFDEVLALFTEDAAMQLPDATYTGRDAIREIFEGASARSSSSAG